MEALKEQCSLYYKDNRSDKEYHAQLQPEGDGWVVSFQFGRRGQSLQTGRRTQSPVAHAKAKKVYDQLVQSKMSKGYSPGEKGTPCQGSEKAGNVSGILPQLLNFIDEDEARKLLHDPEFFMQEKMDGVRCLVRKNGELIEGINRKGLIVPLPEPIVQDMRAVSEQNIVLDGERIGDVFWVFDCLEFRGQDVRMRKAEYRLLGVFTLMGAQELNHIKLVSTVDSEADKVRMFKELQDQKREGVVFKRGSSPYVPGRPNSGGAALKHKFYASATLQVLKVNDKRSVQLGARTQTEGLRFVGNVTIPANCEIPRQFDLIETRYLYAFEGGSLFQPVYLGLRADKAAADDVSSLKYKATSGDEDAR